MKNICRIIIALSFLWMVVSVHNWAQNGRYKMSTGRSFFDTRTGDRYIHDSSKKASTLLKKGVRR